MACWCIPEMSSSWNFPAQASPSCEVSGSSEPELGTSIFELKLSWQHWQYAFQKIANSELISQFCYFTMILINFMLIYLNLYSKKGVFRVELYELGTWFSHFQNKLTIKIIKSRSSFENRNFGLFSVNFQFQAEVKKVTSWAKPSWKSFSSSYGSGQFGSDSSLLLRPLEAWTCSKLFHQFKE